MSGVGSSAKMIAKPPEMPEPVSAQHVTDAPADCIPPSAMLIPSNSCENRRDHFPDGTPCSAFASQVPGVQAIVGMRPHLAMLPFHGSACAIVAVWMACLGGCSENTPAAQHGSGGNGFGGASPTGNFVGTGGATTGEGGKTAGTGGSPGSGGTPSGAGGAATATGGNSTATGGIAAGSGGRTTDTGGISAGTGGRTTGTGGGGAGGTSAGGSTTSGGATGSGGTVSMGGSSGTGGRTGTGGGPETGGATGRGGATGSGGIPTTGGAGGLAGRGGSTGGSSATGGAKGTGGSTSTNCYTAPATQVGTPAPGGRVSGYGSVLIAANANNQIVRLQTTMVVPPEPPPSGTLFLWPGLDPDGANFNPINNGVLQPVLTWGSSCAPGTQPRAYSTWWISSQYVNTNGNVSGYTGCNGGSIMSVNVCDTLDMDIQLSGTVWIQTVTDIQTNRTVTYSIDMQNQAQNLAYFVIEEYSSAPVSEVIFTDTTITFASSDAADCKVNMRGQNDYVSTPVASSDGLACSISQIILRAQGIQ